MLCVVLALVRVINYCSCFFLVLGYYSCSCSCSLFFVIVFVRVGVIVLCS